MKRGDKAAPRGAAAAVKKRSLKSLQGIPLPPDGSGLESYPVGCAVLVEVSGEPAWYLVRFQIGGRGAPHVGRLSSPPDRPGWNARMGPAIILPGNPAVLSSRWPYREGVSDTGGEGGDDDPLALTPSTGSIMQSHLRGAGGSRS